MLYVRLYERKNSDGNPFVGLEISFRYDLAMGHFLRQKGYKFNHARKCYYKNYNQTAENKVIIREVINDLKTKQKYFKMEHFKLVNMKENVNDILETLGVEA